MNNLPFLIFVSYLVGVIFIGIWGFRNKQDNSLRDYYLASGKLTFLPLFFTIYSTKFSGNTFLGFSAKAYRDGFIVFFLLIMWCLVSVTIWLYAPKIKKLADKKLYLTVGDYIQDRFCNKGLTRLVNIILLFVLANYILSNMKAIGYLMEYAFADFFTFKSGIFILTTILIIYQCLGGMKSVSFTDIVQGVLMMLGSFICFYLLCFEINLSEAFQEIKLQDKVSFWWQDIKTKQLINWGSFLIISPALAFYPHAIQRIFAAKNTSSLKKIYSLSIVIALITTSIAILIGITGRKFFPDLIHLDTENIALRMISYLTEGSFIGTIFMALFFTVIIAAAMSTVDSASLTASSIVVKDFILTFRPQTSLMVANLWGRLSIIILMILLSVLAIYLSKDIFFIVKMKMEILILVGPIILFGLKDKGRPDSKVLFYSLLISLIFVISLFILNGLGIRDSTRIFELNAGFLGLLLNCFLIFTLQKINLLRSTNN